ncbi:MAG: ABC transporter substrate-binding protein [Pseudomonadota bacterium]
MVKNFLLFFLTVLFVAGTAHGDDTNVYYSALTAEPTSLDPKEIRNHPTGMIGNQIHEGLFSYDENMNIIPAVANTWKVSKDGKNINIQIRRGAKFHNGQEVNSFDVIYSISRLVKTEGLNHYLYKELMNIDGAKEYKKGNSKAIKGIVLIDNYSLQINLLKSHPYFYKILAAPNSAIIPANFVERYPREIDNKPVGVGPFKIQEWSKCDKIVLVRHDEYYRSKPNIDKLVFYFMKPDKLIQAFEDGKIYDTASLSLFEDFDVKLPEEQTYQIKLPLVYFLAFNSKIKPFNNKCLRKALYFSLNKKMLMEKVFLNQLPATSTIPYGIGGYELDNDDLKYSPTVAEEMLRCAKASGFNLKQKLILYGRETMPNKEMFKKVIEGDYRKVGLNVEVAFLSSDLFYKKFYNEELGFFYAGHNASVNDALFILGWYESDHPSNLTGMSNKQFDLLMEMARSEKDEYVRSKIYSNAAKIINDEYLQINLFNRVYKGYVNPKVKNFEISEIGPYVRYNKIILE